MRREQITKSAAGCILIFMLCGCGTMIHGGKQNIQIQSEPGGTIVRTKDAFAMTPGCLEINRRADHLLIISKEGFEPCKVEINRRTSSWLWGNILLLPFAPLGVIIDYYTGGYYELEPSSVYVKLNPDKRFQLPRDKPVD